MTVPSDRVLEMELRKALRRQNIEELSLKRLRSQLALKLKVDLCGKKQFLKDTVMRLLSEDQEEECDQEEEEEEEGTSREETRSDEDDDGGGGKLPPEIAKKRKRSASKPGVGGRANKDGIAGKYQLSSTLYEFLGCGEAFMKRGDVTKELWKYIKANDLQDPTDRRKIRNDERLVKVFKCKTMNMFHISKKLSSHLKKYSDLVTAGHDLDEDMQIAAPKTKANNNNVDYEQGPSGAKAHSKTLNASSAKGKTVSGKGSKGANGQKGGKEKKPRQPSTIKWKVTPELAAVVGSEELTFDAIRAGVNKYVKDHKLQDPNNKRTIHCDATLMRIMGQSTVNMFGMQTLYSAHRLHKIT